METLANQLKAFRQGDPLTCQRIWDAIIFGREAATLENVVHYCCQNFKVEAEYLKQQVGLLVEDGLITKKVSAKANSRGVEQSVIYYIPVS